MSYFLQSSRCFSRKSPCFWPNNRETGSYLTAHTTILVFRTAETAVDRKQGVSAGILALWGTFPKFCSASSTSAWCFTAFCTFAKARHLDLAYALRGQRRIPRPSVEARRRNRHALRGRNGGRDSGFLNHRLAASLFFSPPELFLTVGAARSLTGPACANRRN